MSGCPVRLQDVENVEPWDFYEAIRDRGPLVWDEAYKAWLVVDYPTTVLIEEDAARFRHPYAGASPLLVEIKGGYGNISLAHGEDHDRLRRFHVKLLTTAAVEDYRERMIAPILDHLIDGIIERGGGELAAELADQLPPRLTCALLGMPWQDDALIEQMLTLHQDVMAWVGNQNAGEPYTGRALAASHQLNAILLPYVQKYRDGPIDNFIGRIWAEAPQEYGDMTDDIVVGICRELFLAGSDTTVHGIANTLYLFLTRPDLRERVATERGAALRVFVEETMRLLGAVQYRFRVANQDCELAGTQVLKDQMLILVHAAGNRDPERYACPAEVDLERKRPTDHLAFNKGPRTCVGASLARAEMRDTLVAVLDRLPTVHLDPQAEPPSFKGLFIRSYRPLHVLL